MESVELSLSYREKSIESSPILPPTKGRVKNREWRVLPCSVLQRGNDDNVWVPTKIWIKGFPHSISTGTELSPFYFLQRDERVLPFYRGVLPTWSRELTVGTWAESFAPSASYKELNNAESSSLLLPTKRWIETFPSTSTKSRVNRWICSLISCQKMSRGFSPFTSYRIWIIFLKERLLESSILLPESKE